MQRFSALARLAARPATVRALEAAVLGSSVRSSSLLAWSYAPVASSSSSFRSFASSSSTPPPPPPPEAETAEAASKAAGAAAAEGASASQAAAEASAAAEGAERMDEEGDPAGESAGESDGRSVPEDPAAAREALAKAWSELDELTAARDELKDHLLRTLADMENLRDRTSRQIEAHKVHATDKLVKSFLEVADNLDRALVAVPETAAADDSGLDEAALKKHLRSLRDGVLMTDRVLHQILGKLGIERFDPEGEPFDPNLHSALFELPHPSLEDGRVAVVVKKGYKNPTGVLRAAEVGVVKGKAQ